MHGRVNVKILSAALCSILFSAVSGKAPAADASQENCIVTGRVCVEEGGTRLLELSRHVRVPCARYAVRKRLLDTSGRCGRIGTGKVRFKGESLFGRSRRYRRQRGVSFLQGNLGVRQED